MLKKGILKNEPENETDSENTYVLGDDTIFKPNRKSILPSRISQFLGTVNNPPVDSVHLTLPPFPLRRQRLSVGHFLNGHRPPRIYSPPRSAYLHRS